MKIIKIADEQLDDFFARRQRDEYNRKKAGFQMKAPILEACGNCKYLVKGGLYKCGLYEFNVATTSICESYQKDPSKPDIVNRS